MFYLTEAFNQPLGSSWNNSNNITDMSSMFENSKAFNQDIGSWDTSSVTNMSRMFRDASAFNQDIGTKYRKADGTLTNNQSLGIDDDDYAYTSWDVSNVTTMMRLMFAAAEAFNNGGADGIKNWNVGSNLNFGYMFA